MLSFAHDDEIRKAVQSWSLEKKIIRNPGYRKLPGEEGYDEMKNAGYKRHQKYVNPETGDHEFAPRISNFFAGEGFRADATNPREGGGMMDAAKNIAGRAKESAGSAVGSVSAGMRGAAEKIGQGASRAKESLVGTPGDEFDQRLSRLTNREGSPVSEANRHSAGQPGMVQNAFSSLGNVAQDAAGAMSRAGSSAAGAVGRGASSAAGAVGAGMRGAAEKIGQGASAVASATPGMARNAFSSLGGAARAAGQAIGTGARAAGRGAMAAGRATGRGASAVGRGVSSAAGTAMYGSDRSGRDASGLIMPGMGNLVGQGAAALRGAVSGQGAMNAIEARNQRVYGGEGAPAMDREGQKQIRQNVNNARLQERYGRLPPAFAEQMGYQTPEQRAATNTALPATTGENAALPERTQERSRAGTDTRNQTAQATGSAPSTASTGSASQQDGATYAQERLVDQASQQARTKGGIGTGLLSNVATFGLSGLARGAYNASQRRQGQNRLRSMAAGDFTASFDDPIADYWDLQKQRVVFRDKHTTEAIRNAFR